MLVDGKFAMVFGVDEDLPDGMTLENTLSKYLFDFYYKYTNEAKSWLGKCQGEITSSNTIINN